MGGREQSGVGGEKGQMCNVWFTILRFEGRFYKNALILFSRYSSEAMSRLAIFFALSSALSYLLR